MKRAHASGLLVSNVADTARSTDARLVNPVDIALHHNKLYVSIPAANLVQVYDAECGKLLASHTVTTPTGLAFHCDTLYIGSRNGSIYMLERGAMNNAASVGSSNAASVGSTTAAVYVIIPGGGTIEGIAWHKKYLYVSIASRGYVAQLKDKTAVSSITNDSLHAFNYRPNGIRALDDRVYITYSDGTNSVGSGYVAVYDPKCRTMTNLIVRDGLASPYGLAMQDDLLLVGNRGTGLVLSYDKETGKRVHGSDTLALSTNDGLMGMVRDDDWLYYTAANDNGLMGSVGRIELD